MRKPFILQCVVAQGTWKCLGNRSPTCPDGSFQQCDVLSAAVAHISCIQGMGTTSQEFIEKVTVCRQHSKEQRRKSDMVLVLSHSTQAEKSQEELKTPVSSRCSGTTPKNLSQTLNGPDCLQTRNSGSSGFQPHSEIATCSSHLN